MVQGTAALTFPVLAGLKCISLQMEDYLSFNANLADIAVKAHLFQFSLPGSRKQFKMSASLASLVLRGAAPSVPAEMVLSRGQTLSDYSAVTPSRNATAVLTIMPK